MKKPPTQGGGLSQEGSKERLQCMRARRLGALVQRLKKRLYALDLLEHLEDALGGVLEEALEVLAKAAALEGVATYAFTFSHLNAPEKFLGKAEHSSRISP